jgi:hypothetical protein
LKTASPDARHARDASAGELKTWTNAGAKLWRCRSWVRCHRSANTGSQAKLVIDRITASRLGITPQAIDNALTFGQRQLLRCRELNQYHLVWKRCPIFKKIPRS